MYAPTVFENGSSNGSHTGFPGTLAGAGTGSTQNFLNMQPSGPPGRFSEPGLVERSMMADIGWRLAPVAAVVPEAGTLTMFLGTGGSLLGAVYLRRCRK